MKRLYTPNRNYQGIGKYHNGFTGKYRTGNRARSIGRVIRRKRNRHRPGAKQFYR